jgi:hypothetical protein
VQKNLMPPKGEQEVQKNLIPPTGEQENFMPSIGEQEVQKNLIPPTGEQENFMPSIGEQEVQKTLCLLMNDERLQPSSSQGWERENNGEQAQRRRVERKIRGGGGDETGSRQIDGWEIIRREGRTGVFWGDGMWKMGK